MPQQHDPVTALREVDPKNLDREEFVTLLESAAELAEDGLDLSPLTPEEFARLVSRASTAQLTAVLEHPALRTAILEEIFRRLSEHYLGGRKAGLVRWRIHNGEEVLCWECELSTTQCTVTSGTSEATPRTTLTLAPLDFVKLTSGNSTAAKLLATGKLKIAGDLTFAAALPKLFRIPQP